MVKSKPLFFLGFLTVFLHTHVFAMVTQDVKAAGAQKSKVVEDKAFENYFVTVQDGKNRLHYAARYWHHWYVQKLCAQYKEAGTLSNIINSFHGKNLLGITTPLGWAVFRFSLYIDPDNQDIAANTPSYQDEKGRTIEPFDGYLLTLKTLIEFGAIVPGRNGNNAAQDLLAEIVAAIGADGKIDRKKIGPALKRLWELPCGREYFESVMSRTVAKN